MCSKVSKQEGEETAQQLKVIFIFFLILSPRHYTPCFAFQVKYVEASAKHKLNVEKAFHDLVRVIRQAQKPDSQKEKKRRRRCTIL